MDRPRTRIIMTGATGFSGFHACRYAVQEGYEVVTIGRTASTVEGSTHMQCDITDNDRLSGCIKQVQPELILHLAGWNEVKTSWENPLECLKTNVIGTANLLESVRLHSPEARTVIIGSALEHSIAKGEVPAHPYSLSKTMQALVSESWSRFYPLDVVVIKPTNLIGPGRSNGICSKIASQIARAEHDQTDVQLQIRNLNANCDFLDVRDAIRAYFLAMEVDSDHRYFDIGSGISRTLKQVVAEFEQLTTQPITVVETDPKDTEPVRTDLSSIYGLGWTPHFSFHKSLEDILSYKRSIVDNQ